MPGEVIAVMLVEVVGGIIAHLGVQATQASGRSWLDKRELEKLDDDVRQAFIAGLVLVAAHDGALSTAELDEVESRLRALDIDEKGREVALAIAARDEVAAAVGNEAGYAATLVARIPDGRVRDALLRVGIAVAMRGDVEKQLEAVRLLGRAMKLDDAAIDATIADEKQRLIR